MPGSIRGHQRQRAAERRLKRKRVAAAVARALVDEPLLTDVQQLDPWYAFTPRYTTVNVTLECTDIVVQNAK